MTILLWTIHILFHNSLLKVNKSLGFIRLTSHLVYKLLNELELVWQGYSGNITTLMSPGL